MHWSETLRRLLTPALAVTVALLLVILTGRSDLCIAGVFAAG